MTKKHAQTLPKQKASSSTHPSPTELPTFLDHIRELRRRLFWVVAVILVASSAAYPFLDSIISILTAPLGSQQLYYLTPIGGFSFSIQLCLYAGIVIGVPFIMYHLYRYLEPLMGNWRKSAVYYVGFSTFFAAVGLLFAYFISLPSALHFLTGLNLSNIQAMLTVDSYLTFVMTYMLGAALLFQIPLLLLIINNMTPLKPTKLMKLQKFVIVGAFILAAIISPTPDIMNQLMLALPIVMMYQLGVGFVWIQNRSRARRKLREQQRNQQQPLFEIKTPPSKPQPLVLPVAAPASRQVVARQIAPGAGTATNRRPVRKVVGVDGFVKHGAPGALRVHPSPQQTMRPVAQPNRAASAMITAGKIGGSYSVAAAKPKPKWVASSTSVRHTGSQPVNTPTAARPAAPVAPARAIQVPQRAVDGFVPYRSASAI